MDCPMSSSDSLSSLNNGFDVTNQGLMQQNEETSTVVIVEAGPMSEEMHPAQNNHMTTSSGVVMLESSTLQSATSDDVTYKLDLNLAYDVSDEDAEQETGVDDVNQSLDRNAELRRRNVRPRMNPENEQDFLNLSLSSASPVDSSLPFQPSYPNSGQDNSQYIPGSTSMQSMLVPGTERGDSSRQHLMTSTVIPNNYNSQSGASAAPASTQLFHPLGVPQQNTARSFPSSSTNGAHLPSVRRSAGIGSGGQVGNQIPPPSIAAVAMIDHIESRSGNGRALQPFTRRNDEMPHSLPPSQVSVDEARATMRITVQEAVDILYAAGAIVPYEGVVTADGPQSFQQEPDVGIVSYVDLVALQDYLGNVWTGLNEESILGALRRVTYQSMTSGPAVEEICCICQEQYADSDELGKLDCCHQCHFNCLKEWLSYKNRCPLCKRRALSI